MATQPLEDQATGILYPENRKQANGYETPFPPADPCPDSIPGKDVGSPHSNEEMPSPGADTIPVSTDFPDLPVI